MFKVYAENKDITFYVTRLTWSGSLDQVARKIEFDLAYNTPIKDSSFTTINALELGNTVKLLDDDNNTLFVGKIFIRSRNTDTYIMSYVAYDNLIYLAKSKVKMVFNAVPVSDAINKICKDLSLEITDIPSLSTKVSFIADEKSASETIEMLLTRVKAETNKNYMLKAKDEKVTLIEQELLLQDYVAKTMYNVISSAHSESIEDVVNKVVAIDEVGKIVATYEDTDLINKIGILQDIYKMQPVKPGDTVDNVSMAKSKLTKTKMDSSLNALGDVRVQSGLSIIVAEEQLEGKFLVISDTHTFEGNQHTMDLGLKYLEESEQNARE